MSEPSALQFDLVINSDMKLVLQLIQGVVTDGSLWIAHTSGERVTTVLHVDSLKSHKDGGPRKWDHVQGAKPSFVKWVCENRQHVATLDTVGLPEVKRPKLDCMATYLKLGKDDLLVAPAAQVLAGINLLLDRTPAW